MADFTISKERVQDATNTIIQFLRDSGYEGSLEDGTGLNDIVVKPSAVIYELIAQLVEKSKAYQSLRKAFELRSVIGEDEYNSAIDCILSNWFVTRNDGKPSTGVIRMWFLKPLNFIHFTDGQELGSINNNTIVADREQVFTEANFSYILNTANNQNEYYVDVTVRTKENSNIEPSADSEASIAVNYNDIYFLRTTIPGTFTAGTLMEDSEKFIRRTAQAITTRELITARAINTVILDTFADVVRLYVARHGSSEQLRDIVNFQGITVHVGNKADIYLASWLTKQVMQVEAVDGVINTEQLPSSVSIVGYARAEDEEGNQLPISIACEESSWCSNLMLPRELKVGTYTGIVSLSLLTDTLLGQVHSFVYSRNQRVACYDPMVKHMFPLVLHITLNVQLIDKTIDPTELTKFAVLEYVEYIVTNSQPWVASELVASVHLRNRNIKKITLPVECVGEIYDPFTQQFITLDIGNRFTIKENLTQLHSKQITNNTVQFYSDRDFITIESDYTPPVTSIGG